LTGGTLELSGFSNDESSAFLGRIAPPHVALFFCRLLLDRHLIKNSAIPNTTTRMKITIPATAPLESPTDFDVAAVAMALEAAPELWAGNVELEVVGAGT